MSATSNFAYAVGYAYNWMENATWNNPALRSPIPCRAGYNCTYSGVCSFVHPGEEGAGRRLFPARNAEEKDMVRLFHPTKKPEYYRRREMRLSWPEWCARQGLPAPLAPAEGKAPEGGAAPSGKRKQRIVIQETNSSFAIPIYTLPAPRPITLEELRASAPTVFLNAEEQKQVLGELLYQKVENIMTDPECISALQKTSMYNDSCTAGKIVGMFMNAYSLQELHELNNGYADLHESIMDACEELVADAKQKEQKRVFNTLSNIGWGDMLAELDA